jgi:nicotinamide riboside kinase
VISRQFIREFAASSNDRRNSAGNEGCFLGNFVKLALIGTHGAGKTTIAYEVCSLLKRSGKNVELVREVARRSPFPVNAGTTLEGQLWILHTQIAAELEAMRGAPNVVCDRSVLDNYCYLVNKFGRQPELEAWLLRWMKTYDLLAGIPPFAEAIIRDGFRSEDRDFQRRIDELLKELLQEPPFDALRERVVWMDGPDLSQWAQRIFAAAFPAARSSEDTQDAVG